MNPGGRVAPDPGVIGNLSITLSSDIDSAPTYKIYRRTNAAAVVPIPRQPPDRGDLERLIHDLARDGAFSFESHSFDKCLEEGIDIHDALQVVAHGSLKGKIEPGISAGEWKCKMVSKVGRSGRRLGVVTVVIKDLHLFLTTVDWEDK